MSSIATTLGVLVAAEPALRRLADQRLPVQAAYRVAKLAKVVAEELQQFHTQRNALIKEYGQANGNGPEDVQVTPAMPTWATYIAKVEELVAVDVTIPLAPIDLATAPELVISAVDLLALGPLVVTE